MREGSLRRIIGVLAALGAFAAVSLAVLVPGAEAGPTSTLPWLNPHQPPAQRADELLAAMSLDQKLQMVDGTGYSFSVDYAGHIAGIPSLSVPDLYLADGAVGVGNGSTGVTQFPSGLNDAATWDPSLVQRVGTADGGEQAAKGHNVSLAPNLNILRTPYGGRAFEGYGEDPFLSSAIGAADIQGVQSAGVIATPKHYIGNDQETLRNSINAEVSERALEEIYDPAFKASVDAGAGAVMCAYNRINGEYACQNGQTLTDTLKQAWRFEGFVMSDWWATQSTVGSADAGLDMNMPGGNLFGFPDYYGAALKAAVENGDVSVATLNSMVHRILWAMFSVGVFDRTYPNPADVASTDVSSAADNAVALKAAEQGTVLLKNDLRVLPVGSRVHRIAVIGDPAGSDALYGGGGSASVNPTNPVTPIAGITSRASASGVSVAVAQGDTNYRNLSVVAPDEFTPTSGGGVGWTATYYPNTTFSGTPIGSETVSSLNVPAPPAIVQNAPVWSVKYTATLTPTATGVAEFGLTAGGNAALSIGGRQVISFTPNTGSTFTGLARLTRAVPTSFELDVGQPQCVGPFCGLFGPSAVVDLTWSPQESVLWQQAVDAARAADVAVVFASNFSAEGSDLATLELPGDQDQLIRLVARANPRTVVVLNTSAAVYMPWLGDVSTVLEAWYPGQQYGNAIAALLFGDVDPSGHLPATFPADASQGVAHGGTLAHPNLEFPGDGTNVLYQEGIDVGYRYYDVHGQTPLFPFGYGLSYTTFAYRRLTLYRVGHHREIAQVTITNTGRRSGAEVAQLYLSDPSSTGESPHQLKGFQRVQLDPGQSRRLSFVITPQDMSYYDDAANRWVIAAGRYGVGIGSDERDLAANATYTVR